LPTVTDAAPACRHAWTIARATPPPPATTMWAPVSGQPIAENRMYLPLVAVAAWAGAGLHVTLARRSIAPMAAAAVALFGQTIHRNTIYGSEASIWRDTVAKQPMNGRARVYLAEALRVAGKPREAVDVLAGALRYHPNSAEHHNNIAMAYFGVALFTEAFAHFEAAIRLKPDYVSAYINYAVALYRTGNFASAVPRFEQALRLAPNLVEVHNYAGLCRLRLGNIAAAIEHFNRALQLDPQHQDARTNLTYAQSLLSP